MKGILAGINFCADEIKKQRSEDGRGLDESSAGSLPPNEKPRDTEGVEFYFLSPWHRK